MSELKAVLFDMDGVLVDSYEMWFGILNDVAESVGTPPISRSALETAFGQGVEKDVQVFYPGLDVPALCAAYDEATPRHLDKMVPHPQARAALASLRERDLRTAIVTNTQTSLATEVLKGCGLLDLVDFLSGMGPDVREKPHPDLLLKAMEALGVTQAEALMVGDTEYDELSAKAAGVPFVQYDLRTGGDLEAVVNGIR